MSKPGNFAPRAMSQLDMDRMMAALDAYKTGRIDVSSTIFREELERNNTNFLAWYGAGILCARIRDHENAALYFRLALDYKPKMALPPKLRRGMDAIEGEIRFNLGRVYQLECRPHAALGQYDKSLALCPKEPGTWAQRGLVMLELGKPMDALKNFKRALAFDSQSPNVLFNRALAALLIGDYADGFAGYEQRWITPEHADRFARPDITTPRWDGAPTGQRVLIHAEQGRGDQLQVWRFLPAVRVRAPNLIVETFEEMYDLATANFPGIPFVKRADPLDAAAVPPHDLSLPSMSLFHVMGCTRETLSGAPYLHAPDIGPTL